MNRFENDMNKKTMTVAYINKKLSEDNLTTFERKNYESLKKSLEAELIFMNKEFNNLNEPDLE
jgi:hypothetical protein